MKQILFIENEKDTVLPKEHHKTNNICAIIYDQITEIFAQNKYKTLYETNLSFDETNQKIEEFQNGEMHILDFLKENELNDDIEKILTKHILLSISSDFVNFVFESLSCAKKCKSTVAYALSRKPFTDELFLLEQLLVDRKDFIYKIFHIGEPKNYDPSYKHDKKEFIKKTIENSISKLKMNFFHSKDFIYGLRYDKSLERGLNGVSNKALHIVTTDENYKTADQNLNFIFSKQEDIFDQLNDYYSTIPPLLFYTASVIDEIAFSFTEKSDSGNKSRQVLKQFKRLIGYILYAEANKITEIAKSNEVLKVLSENLNFICENCNQKTVPDRDDFEYFFYDNSINCKSCYSDLLKFNKNIDEICQISN